MQHVASVDQSLQAFKGSNISLPGKVLRSIRRINTNTFHVGVVNASHRFKVKTRRKSGPNDTALNSLLIHHISKFYCVSFSKMIPPRPGLPGRGITKLKGSSTFSVVLAQYPLLRRRNLSTYFERYYRNV